MADFDVIVQQTDAVVTVADPPDTPVEVALTDSPGVQVILPGGAVDSVDGRSGVVTLGDLYKAIGYVPGWTEITGKPATFPPDLTTHLADLNPHPVYLTQAEADAIYKAIGYVPAWAEITDKPATFPPDLGDHLAAADPHIQYQRESEKGSANGYASLGTDGKVPDAQLSALALTDVYVVASEAAQLALTAQEGDVAVRTDQNRSYAHNGGVAGTMADWTELRTPTDAVLSVDGRTGAVTLSDLYAALVHKSRHATGGADPLTPADIGAAAAAHVGSRDGHPVATPTLDGFESAADKAKLDGIETGATADQSAAEILAATKTVDGAGSGLDADLLDGTDSTGFAPASHVGSGGTAHAEAVAGGAAGFLSGARATKLDGLSAQAIGAFLATDGAVQADLPSGVFAKVIFSAESADVSGWYDAVNSRYTPLKAGYYSFSAMVNISPAVADRLVALSLFKNGARHRDLSYQHTSHTANIGVGGAATGVHANGSTDYFEVYFFHNFGVDTSDLAAGNPVRFFSGGFEGIA